MESIQDLSLAYSPQVACPCLEIKDKPELAQKYTNKSNMVAVISNGTAVLGLGNLGALASKPVMEGKSVLFKKFANLDSIDLCIAEQDTEAFIKTVKTLTPSFGGINLEDIKAPECFEIEERLKAVCDIPIMHDDQHGTAVITLAAVLNGCKIIGKDIGTLKIVMNGAGAASLSIHNLLCLGGAKQENIIVCDTKGVIYTGRPDLVDNKYKFKVSVDSAKRTLEEACVEADVFLGLSVGNALNKEWAKTMSEYPIILAMANPIPEISLEDLKEVKEKYIQGTGRSDNQNQVNNVLAFPFIFRGALDSQASRISDGMKMAASKAIAQLANEEAPEYINKIQGVQHSFGSEQIIPKPFDYRLGYYVSLAVATTAIDEGLSRFTFGEQGLTECKNKDELKEFLEKK